MVQTLSIGDFSRATHMTVKTLRHYHRIGLLEPAAVDPQNGYRRYATEQIPLAQVIRRLREVDMPLKEIQGVLSAPGPDGRNRQLAAHLARLESEFDRTREAMAAVRDLLDGPDRRDDPQGIELRAVPPTEAAAIIDVVDAEHSVAWFRGAIDEIRGTLASHGIPACGPAGGIYADEVFNEHRGEATIFIPCTGPIPSAGRVRAATIPAVELAVLEHRGPPSTVDRTYGALGSFVTRHAIAVKGPLREYYLVGGWDTPEISLWRTEVGWPIFITTSEDG